MEAVTALSDSIGWGRESMLAGRRIPAWHLDKALVKILIFLFPFTIFHLSIPIGGANVQVSDLIVFGIAFLGFIRVALLKRGHSRLVRDRILLFMLFYAVVFYFSTALAGMSEFTTKQLLGGVVSTTRHLVLMLVAA